MRQPRDEPIIRGGDAAPLNLQQLEQRRQRWMPLLSRVRNAKREWEADQKLLELNLQYGMQMGLSRQQHQQRRVEMAKEYGFRGREARQERAWKVEDQEREEQAKQAKEWLERTRWQMMGEGLRQQYPDLIETLPIESERQYFDALEIGEHRQEAGLARGKEVAESEEGKAADRAYRAALYRTWGEKYPVFFQDEAIPVEKVEKYIQQAEKDAVGVEALTTKRAEEREEWIAKQMDEVAKWTFKKKTGEKYFRTDPTTGDRVDLTKYTQADLNDFFGRTYDERVKMTPAAAPAAPAAAREAQIEELKQLARDGDEDARNWLDGQGIEWNE